MDPGPGLSFAVKGGELDITGAGGFSYVDLMFGFRVTAPAGRNIKDNSLEITQGSLGWTVNTPADEDLGITIQEWVGDDFAGAGDPGYIRTEFSQLAGAETHALSASSNFAPQQEIWVTKDILVWSWNQGDVASLTGFTQRFSQVPEPGTLALVALAMAGAVAVGRRRGSAA